MFNRSSPSRASSPIPPLPDLPTSGRPAPSAPLPTVSPHSIGSRGLSTLASELQFAGDITGGGDLQVDGSVSGAIKVGRLIVGETGSIEGSLAADYVEIRGRVVGGVNGRQVKLISTAYVDGDITAEQLSIDIGAYFQGRVLQIRPEPAPVVAPAPVVKPAAPPLPQPAALESVTPEPVKATA